MRLPVIPFVVAIILLASVWYAFNSMHSGVRILDAPRLSRLADIDGIETEVAASPDGKRYAVISNGDLWILDAAGGQSRQLTHTPEPETYPAWTPDGKRVGFTRSGNTFVADPDTGAEELLRSKATSMSWSSTNRTAFIRDRALWITGAGSQIEEKLVDADVIEDVDIHSPRFSPDALQMTFIKTQLGVRGEVWVVDIANRMTRPLVVDRMSENPVDAAWINNGVDVVYLTNRAGAYSLWYVDLIASTINPLSQPMITVPMGRIGLGVSKDRVILPRHFVASKIALSDGTPVVNSEKLLYQPAASPDGKLVAYTLADENRSEIWTAGVDGQNATFRTLGRQPRFSPNGFQLVYTHTDLTGNDDIWKLDLRNNGAERITDADELDVSPDWSPDGRSLAFASARGGAISIWTIPASGGKRLRLNSGGYAPRYSPDSKSILFWNREALWTMDADGTDLRQVAGDLFNTTAGVWARAGKDPAFLAKPPVDYPVWPEFDVMPDGRFLVAPIDIRETALWALDLTYKEK